MGGQAAIPTGYFQAPFGTVAVIDDGEFVTGISFGPHQCQPVHPTRLTCDAVRQLRQYFAHRGVEFSLPLRPQGTPFQQRVWQALCTIPYGSVMRYGELAALLGSSPRAVGAACRANPLPILIPCHRVVAASGLGGYAGAQEGPLMEIKRFLLSHEQDVG